jgi:hypothetical protein
MAVIRRLLMRVYRRARSEWANARRAVGLVGWRRVTGPEVRHGVAVGGTEGQRGDEL